MSPAHHSMLPRIPATQQSSPPEAGARPRPAAFGSNIPRASPYNASTTNLRPWQEKRLPSPPKSTSRSLASAVQNPAFLVRRQNPVPAGLGPILRVSRDAEAILGRSTRPAAEPSSVTTTTSSLELVTLNRQNTLDTLEGHKLKARPLDDVVAEDLESTSDAKQDGAKEATSICEPSAVISSSNHAPITPDIKANGVNEHERAPSNRSQLPLPQSPSARISPRVPSEAKASRFGIRKLIDRRKSTRELQVEEQILPAKVATVQRARPIAVSLPKRPVTPAKTTIKLAAPPSSITQHTTTIQKAHRLRARIRAIADRMGPSRANLELIESTRILNQTSTHVIAAALAAEKAHVAALEAQSMWERSRAGLEAMMALLETRLDREEMMDARRRSF